MRFFTAWLILFGSKFVILEALVLAFGDRLRFGGPFHGIVALIVVVVAMLVVEAILVKVYRSAGLRIEAEAAVCAMSVSRLGMRAVALAGAVAAQRLHDRRA